MTKLYSIRFLLLPSILFIQSCNLLDTPLNCDNSRVQDFVKRLYASQVNQQTIKQSASQMMLDNSSSSWQTNINIQPATGIELNEIQRLNPKQFNDQKNSDQFKMIQNLNFEKADFFCSGIIEENLRSQDVETFKNQFANQYQELFKDNALRIPILYSVSKNQDNHHLNIKYLAQDQSHIILAQMLKNADPIVIKQLSKTLPKH